MLVATCCKVKYPQKGLLVIQFLVPWWFYLVPQTASMIAMPPSPAEPSNACFHRGSMTAMPPSCSSEPANACPALLIPPVQSCAWWWWYSGSLLFFVQPVHGALQIHVNSSVSLFKQHILHCVVHVHVYRAQVNLSWSPVSVVAKPVARN